MGDPAHPFHLITFETYPPHTMIPHTLTVELRSSMALKLLKNLESLDVIKILSRPVPTASPDLATRLMGSITAEEADAMHKELGQMRGEWERDI